MIAIAEMENNIKNVGYCVTPCESMPFSDKSYDKVVCFAAFDAMNQTKALLEMNRVCSTGGSVLITGKNDSYFNDDQLAIDAELGARKKNHPNYFTDVKKLIKNVNNFGFSLSVARYYLRRGDFSNENYVCDLPEKFYEYLFVLTKESESSIGNNFCLSSRFSKTFQKNL